MVRDRLTMKALSFAERREVYPSCSAARTYAAQPRAIAGGA
jgi:hypothetical protein